MALSTTPYTAHVGYTESDDDYARLVLAEQHMGHLCAALFQGDPDDLTIDTMRTFDPIDLNKGRDFLTERTHYDVVILHHIWNSEVMTRLKREQMDGVFANSPRHSQEAWRQRLVQTQAKIIIAFGASSEISAHYLDPIPGYKLQEYDGSVSLWIQEA